MPSPLDLVPERFQQEAEQMLRVEAEEKQEVGPTIYPQLWELEYSQVAELTLILECSLYGPNNLYHLKDTSYDTFHEF